MNTIREAIGEIVRKDFSKELKGGRCRLARVVSVYETTCDVVTLDNDVEITGVLLSPQEENGLLIAPAIHTEESPSIVLIASFRDDDYAVVMYSHIDSIRFLDGSYGGLTKTQELKTQLDKTNEVLQAVVDSLKNWTPAGGDGGAALKAFFNTQLGSKIVGDFSNIENNKITHGTV